MTGQHARCPPSSASRTVACPGSLYAASLYPDEDSEAAQEGTAAHWALAEDAPLGATAPNGIIVDDDMVSAAELFDSVIDQIKGNPKYVTLNDLVETLVSAPSVHAESWGRLDRAIIQQHVESGQIKISLPDFKYGHQFVSPVKNWQLINYAAGLIDSYGWLLDDDSLFVFYIVQPRNFDPQGPVRKWVSSVREVRELTRHLNAATHEAMAVFDAPESGRLVVSAECCYCPARHACPALQRAAEDAIELSVTGYPRDLSVDQAARELTRLRRAARDLTARVTGLEAQIEAALRSGASVPSWELRRTFGRDTWTVDADTLAGIGALYAVDLFAPAKPITPNQAIKAGIPAEVVNSIKTSPPGALKLVPVDMRRTRQLLANEKEI